MPGRRERPGGTSLGNAQRGGVAAHQSAAYDGLRELVPSVRVLPEDVAATVTLWNRFAGSTLTVNAGALPAGMTINSGAGTVGGTPTTVGTYSATIREVLAGKTTRDTIVVLKIV